MLCYVMLCFVLLCYVMLCYVMLCYVLLCYVMITCNSYIKMLNLLVLSVVRCYQKLFDVFIYISISFNRMTFDGNIIHDLVAI